MVQTKEERKAYIKTYHIKHKEQITIYGKEWYQKNKVWITVTTQERLGGCYVKVVIAGTIGKKS